MLRLNITERAQNDAVIIDLDGDLVFGEATKTLRRTIRELIRNGKKNIFINLERVVFLDSSGIGELISALIAINREDGVKLRLLNPPDRVQKLFEISKLITVFDIEYEENRAAVI